MDALVFCGIQGAGKSTWYVENLLHSHVRLSLDLLRTRHRETALLHACLAARQPFVIDNTNPTRATRRRYLELARASGFACRLVFFDCPVELALARNAARPEPRRVPEVAIRGTLAKLERPGEDEGFDDLLLVRPEEP